jgi:hypothetical protein
VRREGSSVRAVMAESKREAEKSGGERENGEKRKKWAQ